MRRPSGDLKQGILPAGPMRRVPSTTAITKSGMVTRAHSSSESDAPQEKECDGSYCSCHGRVGAKDVSDNHGNVDCKLQKPNPN